MRVLAIDPGPTRSGWALVETLPARKDRVRWVEAGHDETADVFVRLRAHEGPVIIEDVIWMANKDSARRAEEGEEHADQSLRAAPMLLATKGVAMLYAGVSLERHGMMPMLVSSTTWRRAIIGKKMSRRGAVRGPTEDARVKYQLGLRCEGMPAESNNHQRDAVALGIYGLAMLALPVAMRRVQA